MRYAPNNSAVEQDLLTLTLFYFQINDQGFGLGPQGCL